MTEPCHILECRSVCKHFGDGDQITTVLRDVSLTLQAGVSQLLLGPSGSGKSTLLAILAGLLTPGSGEIRFRGTRINTQSPAAIADYRRTCVGFVFQSARLLQFLTVDDNLRLIAANCGMNADAYHRRKRPILETLGISDLLEKRPNQLSGGERQRVAIARATLHSPDVILADEPTAALDRENGLIATQLLIHQARTNNSALLMVSHDTRVAALFDRTATIDSGRLN